MTSSFSTEEIEQLFREYLPDDVTIEFMDVEQYIEEAQRHPYVRMQIAMGIYNHRNIREDFLSPAKVHAAEREQVICSDLLNNLIEGITPTIARDYVRYIAAHETHHFHGHTQPSTASHHAQTELECAQEIAVAHPELSVAAKFVEGNSPVYVRVLARMDDIKQRAKNGAR